MTESIERLYPFPLDAFQLRAMEAIREGHNVIVTAPTGSGKTAIAEYSIHRALQAGGRCFYTTPLKALSNQKFQDFRDQHGEARVGLLTGDISVHRNADIVVMTTEVFRNMLYGTSLGEVSRNLRGVRSVILDEVHYMNDPERGTVWEESIIYAPDDLQLVGLSATIANAGELRDWISATHGETVLISSDYRPVPLRHYYYYRRNLYRLFDRDNQLNPNLRKVARPESRGMRQGRRPRKTDGDKVRPDQVVKILYDSDMLPAIFFVFSRRGCEEAMMECLGAVQEDPLFEQRRQAIWEALDENPGLETNPHLPGLYEGLSVHHAGLLPAWKSLVERLFQRGFIHAVFATETLAAGINMPARTTVISAICKWTGTDLRLMTGSEFLQMSGRAGRRGMDEVGNVVILHHPKEDVREAARLARAPAEPLESNFRPSYGMVLNLLQRHDPETCRKLVRRSFGQFLAERRGADVGGQRRELEEELARRKTPLCPKDLGDLERYRKSREKYHALLKQVRSIQKGPGHQDVRREIERLRSRREALRREFEGSPCHGCPVQQPCAENTRQAEWLDRELRRLDRVVREIETPYWRQFQQLADVLAAAGHLERNRPTRRGELAAALRATNTLLIAEVTHSGALEHLSASQVSAALTAVVTEEVRGYNVRRMPTSPEVDDVLRELGRTAARVEKLQRRHEVDVPVPFNPFFCGLTEAWALGADWEQLHRMTRLEGGDVVRILRRTLDVCRQLTWAPGVSRGLASVCSEADRLLARDEVRESLYFVPTEVELVEESVDE
ncbi:MAG: DEAD/DEAH box helicase [Armatimonadetes bacterium]|nr:DEAD/DEAH box helicase [Armatimonadota bacterium]